LQLDYDLLDNTRFSQNELRLKISGDHFYKDLNITAYSFGIDGNARLAGDEYRSTINLEFSSDSLLNGSSNRKSHWLFGVEGFINNWFYNYYIEENNAFVLNDLGDQFTDPDEDRNEYIAAAYLQTEQHVLPNRLVATAGVRVNYHNEYSRLDEFVWGEQYSPRFALVFLPIKNRHDLNSFKFKLLYNSAFLPPPFLYRRGGIRQFDGTDSLNSQSIESGEFVVYGDLNKHFSYSILKYVNKIDEFILRQGDSYINEPTEKRISGYEMELKYHRESEGFDWSVFANYSFSAQRNFNDSLTHNYFDVFKKSLYSTENSLVRFPEYYVNIGVNAAFKKSKERTNASSDDLVKKRFKLVFGTNLQLIGESTIESTYFINDSGTLEESASSILQQLPSAIVINARVKAYWNRVHLGASIYNLTNEEYYLPSAISKIQRQRAEGRMIYLDFNYLFNRK
jgi:hypothetical protein